MMLTAKVIDRIRITHHVIPLQRLLWKEFSERRWWAVCSMLMILAVSLFAHGQRFFSECGWALSPWNCWNYLPLIFAGVVGLGGFTSELTRGRAFFLFTRAVRWQELLLAKVLFGVIIALTAPALAACIFRLTCPEQYHPFITMPNLLNGIGTVAGLAAVCYLCGLTCSVILPGLAGGLLTVTSAACTGILVLGGSLLVWWLSYYNSKHFTDITPRIQLMMDCQIVGILFFALIGAWWGGISASAALYHDYVQRIKLFAPKFMLSMLIGGLIGVCLPQSLAERWFLRPQRKGSLSPGGNYAMVYYRQQFSAFGIDISQLGGSYPVDWHLDFIRLADNTVLNPFTYRTNWQWVTDTIAYSPAASYYGKRKFDALLYHLDTGKVIPTEAGYAGIPSPDGHLGVAILGVTSSDLHKKSEMMIDFCNLDNGRMARVTIPVGIDDSSWNNCWWESNDTVGCYCAQGEYGHPPDKQRHRLAFHEEVHHVHVPKF